MVSIPSSIVEETLARMYGIASDKRVAFRGRIKHFQRLGFPEGTNTGKGKPATFSVTRLAKLALAFELVQSGLAPSTAAYIVEEWGNVFEPALARTLFDDADVLHDPKGLPGRDLAIIIYADAMWQLTVEGPVSERTEYFGMVRIVRLIDVGAALADEEYLSSKGISSPWRALVIDALWLVSTIIGCLRDVDFCVSDDEIIEDMLTRDDPELAYALKWRSHVDPEA